MRRHVIIGLLLLVLAALLTGCGDRRNLEELTVSLIIGLDLSDKNELVVYQSSPVFSREAVVKEEQYGVKATTVRQARKQIDAVATALTVGGKVQLVLISRKLLEHKDWFQLFDTFYRDAKNSVNARVVAVDGPVSEVLYFMPKDKPRLPLHISRLIDTNNRRSTTVKTTLQELYRQMTDKGVTAAISEIVKDKTIRLKGTALLDEQGVYQTTLSFQENMLMHILQGNKNEEMSLSLHIPNVPKTVPFANTQLSFMVSRLNTETKTTFAQNRFRFEFNIKMAISLTERLFPFDVRKKGKVLEKLINQQMTKELEALLSKIKQNKVDPLGLGIHARAFQYKNWKQAEEHWGETLSQADFHIKVNVKIKNMGTVQ